MSATLFPPRLPVTRAMLDALRNKGMIGPVPDAMTEHVRLTAAQADYLYSLDLVPEKSELVRGEVRLKMSQNGPHVWGVRKSQKAMARIFGADHVFSQTPMLLGPDDMPEPDVFVTLRPHVAYGDGKPPASEVALVIEVSDSTLHYDRNHKAARYALAGLADYWVLDVEGRVLYEHRQPTPTGYARVTTRTDAGTVSPLAAPTATLNVADLLP